jgi:hypothetical protein
MILMRFQTKQNLGEILSKQVHLDFALVEKDTVACNNLNIAIIHQRS